MDKFTQSSFRSYVEGCAPSSRFHHRVMDENHQTAQPQSANHLHQEAMNQLSMFDFNSSWQPQVGIMARGQGMQATGFEHVDEEFFHQTRPLPVKDGKKEAAEKLAEVNHYKEKSIKLQIELAKLQRKYDVLDEKLEKFSGIEASSKATIAECKFRLDELMKQNVQLKSEVAQWKSNCMRTQQAIIPQMQPIPRPNNPYYY